MIKFAYKVWIVIKNALYTINAIALLYMSLCLFVCISVCLHILCIKKQKTSVKIHLVKTTNKIFVSHTCSTTIHEERTNLDEVGPRWAQRRSTDPMAWNGGVCAASAMDVFASLYIFFVPVLIEYKS